MTDWLAVCRAAAEDVEGVLAEMPSPEARSRVVGEGEGGDETTAIDEAAEQAVVERFRSTGEGLCIVSEELGELELGGGGFHVVIDPIDGSLNAKRGIPFFALSLAIADGARDGRRLLRLRPRLRLGRGVVGESAAGARS